MSSPFPTEIVGCPMNAFFVIGAFWAVLFCLWLGQNAASVALMFGMTFLTAWLWGMYSWMVLAVVGGVSVIGGIIFWLAQPSYSDTDARIKEGVIIGLVGLAVLSGLAGLIYWFVNSDSWSKFLSFLPKLLAVAGVLAIVAFFVWFAYRQSQGGTRAVYNPGAGTATTTTTPPQPFSPQPTQPPPPQPTQPHPSHTPYNSSKSILNPRYFYHGTSIDSAWKIWYSGLWLSSVSPAGVWMSDDFNVALSYAQDRGDGSDGYILHLAVDSSLELVKDKDHYYHVELDGAPGGENYYHLEGVEVIKMVDMDNNEIISK